MFPPSQVSLTDLFDPKYVVFTCSHDMMKIIGFLFQLSIGMCLNPIYMMLAAAICCSYAFMLPIATAPNAIVFSNSTLKTIGNF